MNWTYNVNYVTQANHKVRITKMQKESFIAVWEPTLKHIEYNMHGVPIGLPYNQEMNSPMCEFIIVGVHKESVTPDLQFDECKNILECGCEVNLIIHRDYGATAKVWLCQKHGGKKKKYYCTDCGNVYNTYDQLKSVWQGTGDETPPVCPECDGKIHNGRGRHIFIGERNE